MHERGVVHRDIKSENILFSKNGTLKIADFGFSTKVFDDKGGRIIFDISNYVGSPEYNPPELCNVCKYI
jgi:serine/threonine protein kinase